MTNLCKSLGNGILSFVFEYQTVKIVSINSKKISLLCRFLELAIIAYVIGFVLVYKKGYQDFDTATSGLITKVKGVSYTNRSITGRGVIWDVADYVVPPQEKDSFFITTNALITRNQLQSTCPEDPGVNGANCTKDSDCPAHTPILLGNGVRTGKCNTDTNTCEVYAWCPVESTQADKKTVKAALLTNVPEFTVLMKNSIEFSKFQVTRNNIPASFDHNKLQQCRYHPVNEPNCPIFQVGLMLKLANTTYEEIGKIGGIINIVVNWNCNFDFNPDKCLPTYSFRRIDKKNSQIAQGWNFRYANYYYRNETQYRDLIKAYGISFIISVKTKAGKFNVVPLTMNVGSGLALLGIATLLCDVIVFYCHKKRSEYKKHKFQEVKADDAYQPFESDSESTHINNKNSP